MAAPCAVRCAPECVVDCVEVGPAGHSLGGALAQLAAHDMHTNSSTSGHGCGSAATPWGAHVLATEPLHGCSTRQVTLWHCWSPSWPPTGATAGGLLGIELLPNAGIESWSLINDQDAIARGGKFFGLFKRPGERVLMNAKGELLVSPGQSCKTSS